MITELNQDLSLSFVANAYGVDTLYSEGIKAFGPNLELLWTTGNLGFGSDSSCPPAVTMDGSVVSQFGTGGFVVVNGVTGVVQWQNNNVKPRGCFTLSPDMTTMYSNSDSSGAQSQITAHDVATGLQIDASAEGSKMRVPVLAFRALAVISTSLEVLELLNTMPTISLMRRLSRNRSPRLVSVTEGKKD